MKKHIMILLFLSVSLIRSITFETTYGGIDEDYGKSVCQTSDDGYIITGVTNSYIEGTHEVWLIKTDSRGEKTWSKKYGGINYSSGNSVKQTTDGGYIITGSMETDLRSYDALLIKTDSNGNETWVKTFGGVDGDGGDFVQQTKDGGYILTGNTYSYGEGNSDILLIKTDSNGNQTWLKTFGGSNLDFGFSVQQTVDSCFIIVGQTMSFGAGRADLWLIKTNSNGIKIWDKTFGGTESDYGYSVQQTQDGGYIITGTSLCDVFLIKTDGEGKEIWSEIYGGAGSEIGNSVQQTTDGGYIIAGQTNSYGAGETDVYIIKTDSFGTIIWEKTFGGTEFDYANSVQQTRDGGYILTGITLSYGAGSTDVYLIKTDENGSVAIEVNNCLEDITLYQNYPNPFNPVTTIPYSLPVTANVELNIYNLQGQIIRSLVNDLQYEGSYKVDFDASELTTGIYIYDLKMNGMTIDSKKMILLR